MRGSGAICVGLVLLAGCGKPLSIITFDHVRLDGPLEANGRIVTETPPVGEFGPVQPVVVGRVGGSTGCDAVGRVAVIDVDGLLLNQPYAGPNSLGENPVALFREKLDAAATDPTVKSVVIRVNSPGGGVAATETMRADLESFRARCCKPVIAALMDVACGGAYVLATASDQLVAQPACLTGGIGVVLNLYNLRDLMSQYNVIPQSIKAGSYIDMGTSAKKLPPDVEALFQEAANEYHARLKDAVRRGRPNVDEANGTTFDGRVFTATEARKRLLIDRLGTLDDAVALAAELSGSGTGHDVILYRRRNDPAHSVYAVSANTPLQAVGGLFPSLPGLDRSRLPVFLTAWQPEAGLEKLGGR